MTKRNLCDTCLHHAVCRHSTDPAGTAMVICVHYERLIEIGYTLGHELTPKATGIVRLYARLETPPEEDEA